MLTTQKKNVKKLISLVAELIVMSHIFSFQVRQQNSGVGWKAVLLRQLSGLKESGVR